MTEHEPIELERKPDKKGKVIYEAKEPEVKPISREEYRHQLLAQREFCIAQIIGYKDKIRDIEAMLVKVDELEAEGMIVRYKDYGDQLGYETQEKPPLGFSRPTSTKDSGTWKAEEEKRQAKKG
jgi:hypothetical protein